MNQQQFGGSWTILKLEAVRRYLEAYVQVLKYQDHLQTYYIDAFAGTGYVELRSSAGPDQHLLPELDATENESRNILQGSAEQALLIEPCFDRYIFIERSPWRVRQLATLQACHLDRWGTVEVCQEDANVALQRICQGWHQGRDRAVLFLDPFGMSVDWTTLQAISATRSFDVWYLFPLMAVNRLLPRERPPLPEWEGKLNRFFGTDDWHEAFYSTKLVRNLWDELTAETTRVGEMDRIQEFVLARLRTIFHRVADNPRFLCTESGTPLFLLCFATSNPRGNAASIAIRIAEHILGNC